jgi:hypothetical protein
MSDEPDHKPPEGFVSVYGEGRMGRQSPMFVRRQWAESTAPLAHQEFPDWLRRFVPDDWQEQWEVLQDGFANDALSDMKDGDLAGLLSYLKNANSPVLNFRVRQALVDLLEGGVEARWRLTCAKHPDILERRPHPWSIEWKMTARTLMMLQAYHRVGGFKRAGSKRGRHAAMLATRDMALMLKPLEPLSDGGVQKILTGELLSRWKPVSIQHDGQELPAVYVLETIGGQVVPVPPSNAMEAT